MSSLPESSLLEAERVTPEPAFRFAMHSRAPRSDDSDDATMALASADVRFTLGISRRHWRLAYGDSEAGVVPKCAARLSADPFERSKKSVATMAGSSLFTDATALACDPWTLTARRLLARIGPMTESAPAMRTVDEALVASSCRRAIQPRARRYGLTSRFSGPPAGSLGIPRAVATAAFAPRLGNFLRLRDAPQLPTASG
jgi:hypothetical protein